MIKRNTLILTLGVAALCTVVATSFYDPSAKPLSLAPQLEEESTAATTGVTTELTTGVKETVKNFATAGNNSDLSLARNAEAKVQSNTKSPANYQARIDEVVQHFPLNEQNQIDYNDNTKIFLNQVFNTLANRYQNSQFSDGDLTALLTQLENRLPEGVAIDAATLVADYFAYRYAEQSILVPDLSGEDLKAMFAQTQQLRRAYLGEDIAQQLFEQEENMANYIIESQIVQNDESLSAEEKSQRVKQLQLAYNEISAAN